MDCNDTTTYNMTTYKYNQPTTPPHCYVLVKEEYRSAGHEERRLGSRSRCWGTCDMNEDMYIYLDCM